MTSSTTVPETFTHAVVELQAVTPRDEIEIEEVPAPKRLAPFAFALGASVVRESEEVATGRLILLHDPAGHEAWEGTMRLVTYVTAELDPDMASDPLLPAVGWSWLTDALDSQDAEYTAIGGTVTQTMSTRFGDLAGPPTTADIEIRASWTPRGARFGSQMRAWYALLASTAGLPPPGVTALPAARERGSG